MKTTFEIRNGGGASTPDHGEPPECQRTSDRARALGYQVTPTEIEGPRGFMVSRRGLSCLMLDLQAVESFLNRVAVGEVYP